MASVPGASAPTSVPGRPVTRRDWVVVGGAALVSLVTSPVLVVFTAVVGVLSLGGLLAVSRMGKPRARTGVLVAVGLLLGLLPYAVLALVSVIGSSPASGDGGGAGY